MDDGTPAPGEVARAGPFAAALEACAESAPRPRSPVYVALLVLVAALSVAMRLAAYPEATRSPYWLNTATRQLAIAAAFRGDARHFGRYHAPSLARTTDAARQDGVFPRFFPEPPDGAPESEFVAEHDQDVGYGLVMGTLFRIAGRNDLLLMIGLQVALDLAVLLALAAFAWRAVGPAAGLATAFAYALLDPLASAALHPTYYFWPVVATGLSLGAFGRLFYRGEKTGESVALACANGLLLALVATVRSASLLCAPVLGVMVLVGLPASRRRRALLAACLWGSFALGLLPLALRNRAEFGTLMVRRGTMWHSLLAGIAYADSSCGWEFDDAAIAARVGASRPSKLDFASPEYEAACREEANRYLDAHPGFYPRRVVALTGEGFAGKRCRSPLFPFDLLFPWALLGNALLLARNRRLWPLVATPAALWLSSTLGVAVVLMPTSFHLYRLAADTALALLLGLGAGTIWRALVPSVALRDLARAALVYGTLLAVPHLIWIAATRGLDPPRDALALGLEALVALAAGRLARGRVQALGCLGAVLASHPISPLVALAASGGWLAGVLWRRARLRAASARRAS